ncbi:MAG: 4-hydroxy-tetrahydrodipicolinate reductase [Myxococcales bacterium]|nr:4-hydroxy-tetrahydrodipicolinate reductase [Myxococcales bacterium]MCB9521160.1 4-hydroxy-tetrahydrodipicolinate reductase [Myxococcales bacterium]MCB9530518.1 4-hydroxy-tetrahydrodipicolinate reductase [Myxococcales bacterium]
MGQAIERLAPAAQVEVVGRVGSDGVLLGQPEADVVIDFSTPAGLVGAAAHASAYEAALLSGTTGLGQAGFAALAAVADRAAVCHAANMSLGVAVLRSLVTRAAAALPASFDVEIVEVHHRRKVDAPSGTAVALEAAVRAGRAVEAQRIGGRDGLVGPRQPAELGVHAVRGGDVVGEHTVLFLGDGERVELAHRATSRDVFAQGALVAARWLTGRAPGRYTIDDVLGLG